MSKRDILAYTKSLVRAGVMERPLWMAAVERCVAAAACRLLLAAVAPCAARQFRIACCCLVCHSRCSS